MLKSLKLSSFPRDVFFAINKGLTPMSLSDQEISSLGFEEINRAGHLSDLSLPWRNSTTPRKTICKHLSCLVWKKTKVPSFNGIPFRARGNPEQFGKEFAPAKRGQKG